MYSQSTGILSIPLKIMTFKTLPKEMDRELIELGVIAPSNTSPTKDPEITKINYVAWRPSFKNEEPPF